MIMDCIESSSASTIATTRAKAILIVQHLTKTKYKNKKLLSPFLQLLQVDLQPTKAIKKKKHITKMGFR